MSSTFRYSLSMRFACSFLLLVHSGGAFQSVSRGIRRPLPRFHGNEQAAAMESFRSKIAFNVQKPLNKDVFQLDSVAAAALGAADTFWRTSPYAAAAIFCGTKATIADFIAQKRQIRKDQKASNEDESQDVDSSATKTPIAKRRSFAYLMYGALYQGISLEYIYNHIYPAIFGAASSPATVATKVVFDVLVQATLVTLPIAYMAKALIYQYSFGEAMRRYGDDIRNHGLLTKYIALWTPVQCLTFSIIPVHYRVTFVGIISFMWLIVLSSIASKTRVLGSDEDCLLEDGQTCRIDG